MLFKEIITAFLMGMVVPGLILNFAAATLEPLPAQPPEIQAVTEPVPVETVALPVLVRDLEGKVREMDMDTYLVGVVLAEMPASFHEEALKAQAVVARTYTLRAMEGKRKHDNAAVCTDSKCCQAYCDQKTYISEGGHIEDVEKILLAVKETEDEVLVYQGELIEATYFSCSGGSTEDAVAVWGTDVPYLQAVPSPGEEKATYYDDTVTFDKAVLAEILDIPLENGSGEWFVDATYTAGGGVENISICGNLYTGVQIRQLLNLKSTAFTWTEDQNSVTFHTRGYGHRVGMSQYGADAMAEAGSNYVQILQHYYRGAVVQKQ
jgi:stage II sporulation protein D